MDFMEMYGDDFNDIELKAEKYGMPEQELFNRLFAAQLFEIKKEMQVMNQNLEIINSSINRD